MEELKFGSRSVWHQYHRLEWWGLILGQLCHSLLFWPPRPFCWHLHFPPAKNPGCPLGQFSSGSGRRVYWWSAGTPAAQGASVYQRKKTCDIIHIHSTEEVGSSGFRWQILGERVSTLDGRTWIRRKSLQAGASERDSQDGISYVSVHLACGVSSELRWEKKINSSGTEEKDRPWLGSWQVAHCEPTRWHVSHATFPFTPSPLRP